MKSPVHVHALCLIVAGSIQLAPASLAQDEVVQLEEVIVTATRREENLQIGRAHV